MHKRLMVVEVELEEEYLQYQNQNNSHILIPSNCYFKIMDILIGNNIDTKHPLTFDLAFGDKYYKIVEIKQDKE